MKILIIGFGSIGQRHYRNLIALGHTVAVYDPDAGKIKERGATSFASLDQKSLKGIDAVFICSPTHLHLEQARLVAHIGVPMFIEKPLAHTLKGIGAFTNFVKRKKIITMVGCNMRFHPCLRFIKGYLDEKKLGRVFNVRHEFGSYLPSWRPHQDYRKNYAAKRSTGGGIILDDIHEFDLLFWLNDFVSVSHSALLSNHASNLELETEDQAAGVFLFRNGVMGEVHSDYLSQAYRRRVVIIGERGNLTWDFKENIVWLETNGGREQLFALPNYDFNNVYIEEVKYFLDCVKRRASTFNDVARAAHVLKYLLKK